MPSTYSSNLRIELIASGEQANTWGNTTNTNLGTLIEQAISGYVSVDITAGDVTLTALNGASDQSRNMILNVIGSPGVPRIVTAPAVSKLYIIVNNSTDIVAFLTSAGGSTGPNINPSQAAVVYSDGTNCHIANNNAVLYTSITGAALLPVGTTAQRPVGVTGDIRFNTDTASFEGYTGSGWQGVGTGATGGGSDRVFVENQLVVNTDFTLTTGFSASSVGPISIEPGATVTIPSNYSWVIL